MPSLRDGGDITNPAALSSLLSVYIGLTGLPCAPQRYVDSTATAYATVDCLLDRSLVSGGDHPAWINVHGVGRSSNTTLAIPTAVLSVRAATYNADVDGGGGVSMLDRDSSTVVSTVADDTPGRSVRSGVAGGRTVIIEG